MNTKRRGMVFWEFAVIVAIVAILLALLLPALIQARTAALKTEEKRIFGPYQQIYEEEVVSAVNWLMAEKNTPLSPEERGGIKQRFKNSFHFPLEHEIVLNELAEKKWLHAKQARELCNDMRLLLGLMKTAEEPYLEGAKKSFEEKRRKIELLFKEE